ncbi:hypothetical protein Vafri_7352 [Volvox africanus]|uniref:Uncharacterized protein n=1 Tax=Volvox africanus TaxID=51714 RepID=A0A8J4B027_9CHLO|nr:hypothetical protein Vafri_7352 [Volvox africanus]
MVRAVRRCVRNSSTDSALGRDSSATRTPRKTEDGDSLQMLSNVQRQLVQKSFQTYEFEAKIKAKDRDEEHATTANEVLQQALRSHAASVAALHVDAVPSTDDIRQRMPKKSLGRFQYEDLSHLPERPPTEDYVVAMSAADKLHLHLKPVGEQFRQARVEGSSSDSGRGSGSSSSNIVSIDDADADEGRGSPQTVSSPTESPPRTLLRTGPFPLRSTGLRVSRSGIPGGIVGIGYTKPAPKTTHQVSLAGGSSGGDSLLDTSAGHPNRTSSVASGSGMVEVEPADNSDARYAAALHCTDSCMRRADKMLQALRESHGSVPGYSSALPHISKPLAPFFLSTSPHFSTPVKQVASPFRSSATSPSMRHPQTSCSSGIGVGNGGGVGEMQDSGGPSGGGGGGSGGGQHAGSLARQLLQHVTTGSGPQDHSFGTKSYSNKGLAVGLTTGRQQQLQPALHRRSRSPQHGQSCILPDSYSRGGNTVSWSPTEQSPRIGHEGGESGNCRAAGANCCGQQSASVALRPIPPPPPRREPSGTGGGTSSSTGFGLRPTFNSGDGAILPFHFGRSLRHISATDEGDERPGGGGFGGGGGIVAMASATGGGDGCVRDSASVLVPVPPVSGNERLFTRISRSVARSGPQQHWIPTFNKPLPSSASSAFTAASCGASPYAAPGLSACEESGATVLEGVTTGGAAGTAVGPAATSDVGGGGSGRGRGSGSGRGRTAPAPPQPPTSGLPVQADALSQSGPACVKLPPISDISGPSTAGHDATETQSSRRARVRPSLSCSAAEGSAVAAAFVQRTRRTQPAPAASASWRMQRGNAITPQAVAAAAERDLMSSGPGNAKGPAVQSLGACGFDRECLISSDGDLHWHLTDASDSLRDAANVGPGGVAAASTVIGGGGGSDSAFSSPRDRKQNRHRRAAVQDNSAAPRIAGFRSARVMSGSGVTAAEDLPGSPSIMSRMKQALGNFWGRNP